VTHYIMTVDSNMEVYGTLVMKLRHKVTRETFFTHLSEEKFLNRYRVAFPCH
jgi:hypothetical protein